MKKIISILFFLFITLFTNAQSTGSTTTGYGALKYQVFSSTTTWTPTAGVNTATVECWSAGGNGGSAANSGANGGGGAGSNYVKSSGLSVTQGTSYTVTVGAQQSGNGTNGNDSWFNTTGTIIAKGGLGGTNSTSGNGAGATASTTGCIGNIINKGGNGGTGSTNSGAGGGGAGSNGAGNNASVSTHGNGTSTGGGNGADGVNNSVGANGATFGGGGSGGDSNNGTTRNGGQGASGQVIVEWKTTHLGFM